MALRSGNISARTKAKVLIQLLSNRKRDVIKREKVQEVITEFNKVTPSKEHLTLTILNQSGLGNLLPDLIMTGNSLPYWKTGLFLLHSYLQNPANGDKFITAIKMLTDLTDGKQISVDSKCFLFYLAGKIEKHRKNDKAATQYFQECKAEAPLIYEHLMNQDSAYDLHELQNYLIKAKDGNE